MSAPDKIMVKVTEAAEMVSQSEATIKRAINTTGVDADGKPTFPPPLKAKRNSKGVLFIKVTELEAWADRFDDA